MLYFLVHRIWSQIQTVLPYNHTIIYLRIRHQLIISQGLEHASAK